MVYNLVSKTCFGEDKNPIHILLADVLIVCYLKALKDGAICVFSFCANDRKCKESKIVYNVTEI